MTEPISKRRIEIIGMHEYRDVDEDPVGPYKAAEAISSRLDGEGMLHLDFSKVKNVGALYLRVVLSEIQKSFDQKKPRGAMAVTNINPDIKANLNTAFENMKKKQRVPAVAEVLESEVTLITLPSLKALAKMFDVVLQDTLKGEVVTVPGIRAQVGINSGSVHQQLLDLATAAALARHGTNRYDYEAITPVIA